MRCPPHRLSVMTGSRRKRRAGSTPSRGRTGPPSSGRSGSPSDTRPVIRTSATPSARATLGRRTHRRRCRSRTLSRDVSPRWILVRQRKWASSGHDDDITDYSPDGVAARAEAARAALRELDGVTPEDDVDVVTLAAMRERLGVQIELHDAGLDVGELNVIASPLQSMRDVFDLMATDTDDDWRTISQRLSRVPDRVAGYAASLARGGGGRATRPRSGRWHAGSSRQARSSSCSSTWWPTPHPTTMRCTPNCRHGRRRPPTRTAGSLPCCATRSARTPAARTRSVATPTGCSRGCISVRPWISTRPTSGACDLLQSIVAEQESIAHRLYPESSVAEALRRLDEEPRYLRGGHRHPAELDAGAVRSRRGRAGRHAFRDRRTAAPPGVPDRTDADRRNLLHRPVGRSEQARPDVVVGAAGQERLPHVG